MHDGIRLVLGKNAVKCGPVADIDLLKAVALV